MRRTTVISLDNFKPDSLQCNRGVSSETVKPIKMRHAVFSSRGHRPAALHCTQHSLCKPCEDASWWWWDSEGKETFCRQTLVFDSFKDSPIASVRFLQGLAHRQLYCLTLQMMIQKTCLQLTWGCLPLEVSFVCQISDFMLVCLKYACIAPHGEKKTVRNHSPH